MILLSKYLWNHVYIHHRNIYICVIVYRKQVEKGAIAAFFPLHNLKRKQEIRDNIVLARPWSLPLFRIKVRKHVEEYDIVSGSEGHMNDGKGMKDRPMLTTRRCLSMIAAYLYDT